MPSCTPTASPTAAMNFTIAHAETESSIARCFPVMAQLRPHIPAADFVGRVQRQQKEGYRLAYLEAQSQVRALAGYRIEERLVSGRMCYVDSSRETRYVAERLKLTCSGQRDKASNRVRLRGCPLSGAVLLFGRFIF